MRTILFILLFFMVAASPSQYSFDHQKNTDRFISFWATWCEACKQELKEIDAHLDTFKKVNLVLINVDSDFGKAENWLKSNTSLSPKVLHISDADFSISSALSLKSFPYIFVVNKRNEIVFQSGKFDLKKLRESFDSL